MKFVACFLLLALVEAAVVEDVHPTKSVDVEFLQKQKSLYDLVYHVGQHYAFDDKFVPERFNSAKDFFSSHQEKYTKPEYVSQWLQVVKRGLTPKNRSPAFYRWNYNEATALFNIFYFAKDYETFFQAANWAREHVNEMIFTYALTVAVYHRADTQGLIMPPFYEIFPSYFTNSNVFLTSYRIKTQGYVTDRKFAESQGVYVHEDNLTYSLSNNFTYEFQNFEQKLDYFTNDVGLNNYYYYYHVNNPFWMGSEQYGLKPDRRGEQYYYVHQQLLARYTMERYSNGLGEVPRFFWRQPIPNGYYPNTLTHAGSRVPARPDFYEITNEYSDVEIQRVEDYERRIRDAIYNGYFTVFGGEKIPLSKPEDIEHLSDFIQGNPDFGKVQFFKQYPQLAKRLLGGAVYSNHNVPSTLEQYFTSTRDPMYYQFASRIMRFFYSFKDTLPSYTKQELFFNGVSVDDVKFTPLTTYFEPYEFDITNGIYQSKEEMHSHKDQFIFQARQNRLNYKPFTVTLDVTSESDVDASVRIFLGPKYDSFGHSFDLNTNRFNFVELDFFKYQLKQGKNSFTRKSSDFAFTVGDHKFSKSFYYKIKNALQNQQKFSFEKYENDYSWPQNLLLPKGSEGGMEYQVYVIVTPYQPEENMHAHKYAGGEGPEGHFHEVRAFGFPFDRPIDQAVFFTPNTFFSKVVIYHKGFLSTNDSYKIHHTEGTHYEH